MSYSQPVFACGYGGARQGTSNIQQPLLFFSFTVRVAVRVHRSVAPEQLHRDRTWSL